MSYIAIDVTVRRASGEEESYTLSVNNKLNDHVTELHELLVKSVAGDLNLIEEIKKVQSFLLCSGYGLSNCIILTVSDLYETNK